MDHKKIIKTTAVLAVPLLLFVVLFIPYNWANQQFLVKWFGCSCPKVNELGEIIHPDFNANDFTALFWLFISICATAISGFLSKTIPKEKMWLRALYVAGMLAASLLITRQFCQMMMWK